MHNISTHVTTTAVASFTNSFSVAVMLYTRTAHIFSKLRQTAVLCWQGRSWHFARTSVLFISNRKAQCVNECSKSGNTGKQAQDQRLLSKRKGMPSCGRGIVSPKHGIRSPELGVCGQAESVRLSRPGMPASRLQPTFFKGYHGANSRGRYPTVLDVSSQSAFKSTMLSTHSRDASFVPVAQIWFRRDIFGRTRYLYSLSTCPFWSSNSAETLLNWTEGTKFRCAFAICHHLPEGHSFVHMSEVKK